MSESGAVRDWSDAPRVRYPLLRARVGEGGGGQIIAHMIEADVTSTNDYQADRLRGAFRLHPADGFGMRWWGDQAKLILTVEIGLGQPGGDARWFPAFIGEVDHLSADPARGVVECEARDLSARFIDAKTQEAFLNQTSSEVVSLLAGRRGLKADVTPTQTLVSRYYQQDHDAVSGGEFRRATTEWDLMSNLARNEGFDLYVVGTTLHFHPHERGGNRYAVRWDGSGALPFCNVMDLQLERALTLSKNSVAVAVRSWHGRKGKGFTKTSPGGANLQKGDAQRFVVTRPDLSEDQAQKLADSIRRDIIKNERIVSFTRPGDLDLTPRDRFTVQGTDSSWDQEYWVSQVTRRVSFDGGFTMQVRGKNHSPESDGAIL